MSLLYNKFRFCTINNYTYIKCNTIQALIFGSVRNLITLCIHRLKTLMYYVVTGSKSVLFDYTSKHIMRHLYSHTRHLLNKNQWIPFRIHLTGYILKLLNSNALWVIPFGGIKHFILWPNQEFGLKRNNDYNYFVNLTDKISWDKSLVKYVLVDKFL